LEKELEEARNKFALVKKAKYRAGQTSDGEGDMSGYESSFGSLNISGMTMLGSPHRPSQSGASGSNYQPNPYLHSTPTPLESPQQVNQISSRHQVSGMGLWIQNSTLKNTSNK
jgi:hypothetical protein